MHWNDKKHKVFYKFETEILFVVFKFYIFLCLSMIANRATTRNVPEPYEIDPEPYEIRANLVEENEGCFEGDMELTEDQENEIFGRRNVLTDPKYRWEEGRVPYVWLDDYTDAEKNKISDAMRKIEEQSCIKFVLRMNETDYIKFDDLESGCFSSVGRRGGEQILNLKRGAVGEGCFMEGRVIHELLHALGFFHQQSAWNRNNYIKINKANIKPDRSGNFRRYNATYTGDFGLPYDLDSIMHYGPYAFSKGSEFPTIEVVNEDKLNEFIDVVSAGFGGDSVLISNTIHTLKAIVAHFTGSLTVGYVIFIRTSDEDDVINSLEKKSQTLQDILADSDSDLDDDMEVDKQPTKKAKQRETYIQEDPEGIVDLADINSIGKITSTKPSPITNMEQNGTEKKKKEKDINRGFKTADDGRLIIAPPKRGAAMSDSDDDDADAKETNTKKRSLENDSDSSDDEGNEKTITSRKRKAIDSRSVASSMSGSRYVAGGKGIHRPMGATSVKSGAAGTSRMSMATTKSASTVYGGDYKAKKAKGDIKKKGKMDPYAYIPLTRNMLNKRKKAKSSGQFKGIVSGARKGAAARSKNRIHKTYKKQK